MGESPEQDVAVVDDEPSEDDWEGAEQQGEAGAGDFHQSILEMSSEYMRPEMRRNEGQSQTPEDTGGTRTRTI